MKKIGLFCSTIFHYYIYENIIKHVPNEYIFILPIFESKSIDNEVLVFIRDKGYPVFQENELLEGHISFEILISPYWRPSFELYPIQIKMVRAMYGYAKDQWNYAEWNKNYDLILGYGLYAEKQLSDMNYISIGNPRYIEANEQRNPLQDQSGRALIQFIDSTKSTILYAPTWGELSSYSAFLPRIKKLGCEYNLIVKSHHLLQMDEEEFKQNLDNLKVFYCNERIDIFSLLPNVDLLISDYSGAIFDGVLAGIPVALVNNQDQFIDQGQLEGLMRNYLKVISTATFASCQKDIERVLNNDAYLKSIITLRQQLFSNVGQSTKLMKMIKEALKDLSVVSESRLQNNKRMVIDNLFKRSVQSVVLCGGGEYGKSLASLLRIYNISIDVILDNFSGESSFNGIPILSVEDFFSESSNSKTHFIIATKSGASYFTETLFKRNILNENITQI